MADKQIFAIVALLAFVSLLAVYSTSGKLAYVKMNGDMSYYILRHAGMLAGGFLLMVFFVFFIPPIVIRRTGKVAMVVAIIMLFGTCVYGLNINSARRAMELFGVSVQTSDIAKLAIVMFTAMTLTDKRKNVHDGKTITHMTILVFLAIGLVFSSNLSTAVLMFMTYMTMLFFGSVRFKHMLNITGVATGLGGLVIASGLLLHAANIKVPLLDSATQRVETWVGRMSRFGSHDDMEQKKDDVLGENYQSRQAQLAIASGGLTGKGIGRSTQRYSLPHPYSDFIYAIIIEETGLGGGVFVLFLYLWLLQRVRRIVRRNERYFSNYLVIGLLVNILYQAFMHMAVALGVMPVTGQPLPFVSMGGSAILITGISFGMILRVSSETEMEQAREKAHAEAEGSIQNKDESEETDTYHETITA